MFTKQQLLIGYGDYRESIGRPRLNTLENINESIPFAHFEAGVKFAFAQLRKHEVLKEKDIEEVVNFGIDEVDPLDSL